MRFDCQISLGRVKQLDIFRLGKTIGYFRFGKTESSL